VTLERTEHIEQARVVVVLSSDIIGYRVKNAEAFLATNASS